jgi:hypothetical protein
MRFFLQAPLLMLLFSIPSIHAQSVEFNPAGNQTVIQPPATSITVTGGDGLKAQQINTVVNADLEPGSDIGAKIVASVARCKAQRIVCTIEVHEAGTISTDPVLPMGFSLRFDPAGVYTLSTNWTIPHRGTTYLFNNAKFYCTVDNGTPCVYVGKQTASVVKVSGKDVHWISGTQFTDIDGGDAMNWSGGAANVASVNSPTSITLVGPAGTLTNQTVVFYMSPDVGLGAYTGQAPVLDSLNILGTNGQRNTSDSALTMEMVSSAVVRSLRVTDFFAGSCLNLKGVLTSAFYDLHCNVDGSGLILDQNTLGGFLVTGSNANRFYGVDLVSSPLASGNALLLEHGSNVNLLDGVRVEGNSNQTVGLLTTGAGGNQIHLLDWERNTSTSSNADIVIQSDSNVISGPSQFQSNGSANAILLAPGTQSNILENLTFFGSYKKVIEYRGSAAGKMLYITNETSGTIAAPNGSEDLNNNYTVNSLNSLTGYSVGNARGFSGTKKVGNCVFTIRGGIITNVTGC